MSLFSLLNKTVIFLIITHFLPAIAHTQTIYKSIDKNGQITYSSSSTAKQSSERVEVLLPPSETDIQAAKLRHNKNLETGKMLDKSRQTREKKLAEQNQLKRERKVQAEAQSPPEEVKEQGPYYGIPGHGIIVLPKGSQISQ